LSLPARANQEAGFIPTHRYGRGSDLEVILEVIGSADRLWHEEQKPKTSPSF
jgi:hypothetical protein